MSHLGVVVLVVVTALVSFHTTTCFAIRASSFISAPHHHLHHRQVLSSSSSQLHKSAIRIFQDVNHRMTTSCSKMKLCMNEQGNAIGVKESTSSSSTGNGVTSYISMKAVFEPLARMHVMIRRRMSSASWSFVATSSSSIKVDDTKVAAKPQDLTQRAQQAVQKPLSDKKSNDDKVNSADEDDEEPGEDIEVKDYAHPGRKPPIHNKKH